MLLASGPTLSFDTQVVAVLMQNPAAAKIPAQTRVGHRAKAEEGAGAEAGEGAGAVVGAGVGGAEAEGAQAARDLVRH